QARVLDRDDGLRGKILDQIYLLIVEGSDLLAVHANGTDQLVLLDHRHSNKGPRTSRIDEPNDIAVALDIGLIGREVGNVEDLPGSGQTGEWDVRIFVQVNQGLPPHILDI